MQKDDTINILAVGVTAATGAASASFTLPVNSSGLKPRYIRIAGINECYVKLGTAGVTATTNDILIQPADSLLLCVGSCTTLAHIQGTAVGKINVTPLDDEF